MNATAYVPILVGKPGELSALEALSSSVESATLPLVQVRPLDWDHDEQRPKLSLKDHLEKWLPELEKRLNGTSFIVDASLLPAEDDDGNSTVSLVLEGLRDYDVTPIPSISLTASDGAIDAAMAAEVDGPVSLCLRLMDWDVDDSTTLRRRVRDFCREAGATTDSVVAVIDLGEVTSSQQRTAARMARDAYAALRGEGFHTITVGAGSFPVNLGNVEDGDKLSRVEWLIWRELEREYPGEVGFSDYAIQNPQVPAINPKVMRVPVALRYATDSEWLVLKRSSKSELGFGEFNLICRELVKRSEFQSRDFSAGDRWIAGAVGEGEKPGNATTWRFIGTNHHITTVVDQLANLAAP